MKYLGIDLKKPRIAIFDFTSCEGCELQLVNLGKRLPDFLRAVDVVQFRVADSALSDPYDIALIDGAVSRYEEVRRLERIRQNAKTLVALGSCACFGGVNRLKNQTDLELANQEVYGNDPKETLWVKSLKEIVPTDLEIPGCPVRLSETVAVIQHLILGVPFAFPDYPVCVDCKQRFVSCLMEQGRLCLGPVTRGGCGAPCPASGLSCYGCRGPVSDANFGSFLHLALERGFTPDQINEMLYFFGGFQEVALQ